MHLEGASPPTSDLIDATTELFAESGTYAWFARVGTASNIADGPSRLDCGELLYLFPEARRRQVAWDTVLLG